MDKRCKNFTDLEKKIFLDIVKKLEDIIESKETDNASLNRKREAWLNIAKSFNEKCITGQRSVQKLKNLYFNLKRQRRKGYANFADKLKIQNIEAKYKPVIPKKDEPVRRTSLEFEQVDVTPEKSPYLRFQDLQLAYLRKKLEVVEFELQAKKEKHNVEMAAAEFELQARKDKHNLEMEILRNQEVQHDWPTSY